MILRELPLTRRQRLRAWSPVLRLAAWALAAMVALAGLGHLGGGA